MANWKIEKIISREEGEYDYAVVGNHPNATENNYVLYHRILMENHIGRLLEKDEIVYHINKNKKDNRIENLQILNLGKHSSRHEKQKGIKYCVLKCPNCKISFERELRQTFIQKGTEYTCCSKKCRGQFSMKIKIQGLTDEHEIAIAENITSHFLKIN